MIRNMLVAVDGSAHSKRALEFACELATRFDAPLALLHVVRWAPGQQTLVLGTSHATIPAPPEAVETEGRSVLDAATELAERRGVRVSRTHTRTGSPAEQILQTANETGVDTIVIGSRGLGDLGGLLLGSVSHKVAHLATCTCITVR